MNMKPGLGALKANRSWNGRGLFTSSHGSHDAISDTGLSIERYYLVQHRRLYWTQLDWLMPWHWSINREVLLGPTQAALLNTTGLTKAVVTCKINYFSLCRRLSEIILFLHVETCLKLFQNYFTGLLQLVNIFQHVRCRRNNLEMILELFQWPK